MRISDWSSDVCSSDLNHLLNNDASMDLRFLQTFVHVVELGSIAKAARFQDLTPASVQQRLRALDALMGSQLLTRAGRSEERRVGKGWVSTGRSRGAPDQ